MSKPITQKWTQYLSGKLRHQACSGLGLFVFLIQICVALPTQSQTEKFKSFSTWCLNKEKISPQARRTVDLLLQKAGTSDCAQANQVLSNLSELTIAVSQISDVSPIAALTNLRVLRLGGNQISDISSLSSLVNLTQLSLPGNRISNISSLKFVTHLTRLDLASNQISDISPLKSLSSLTSLDLSYNRIKDSSPLKSLTNLSELNLQGNPISRGACRQTVRPGYAASGSGRINCQL